MDLQYQRPPDAFFSGAASRRSPDGGFFRSDEQLRQVANLHDFAGMLVFDKWTCNTNGRQTLFFQEPPRGGHPTADSSAGEKTNTPYSTLMIDQGFCFNAGEWNFPDAPLRGLYARNRVYEAVTGM